MNNNIDYFNQAAKTFDKDPVKIQRAQNFAAKIKTELKINQNFVGLDYGCGTGLASFFLQPFMKKIVLADNSPGMLAVLDEKIKANNIKNMSSIKLDIMQDAPPKEQFDIIFSLMTLHHILDTTKILKALYSLLKFPGYLCIGDLNKEDGSFHDRDFTGHIGFDLEELSNIAKIAGFKNIRFQNFFHMEKKINVTETRNFPLFLMVAEKC
jgi:ubiquinone/menaquinone biosynthesis C-methylase UbiE